jgi:protein-tyrosine phosphatase
MAEGFTRRLSSDSDGHAEVSSVGIVGWDGSPATSEAVAAAAERGADISSHVARRLERGHLGAGAVVCMTFEHRDAVLRLVPDADSRTFTLKELVRLLESGRPSGSFEERIRAAHELRRSGSDDRVRDEDVADPIGMGFETYRATAWEIDEWCTRLMAALFTPSRSRVGGA